MRDINRLGIIILRDYNNKLLIINNCILRKNNKKKGEVKSFINNLFTFLLFGALVRKIVTNYLALSILSVVYLQGYYFSCFL